MEATKPHPDWTLWVLIFLLLAAAGSAGYLWYDRENLRAELANTITDYDSQLANKDSELAAANERINTLESTLTQVRNELDDLEDDYRDEKNKNDEFEDKISDLTGTVRDLDKLSKTDKELLQKYSKVYFLNENYQPSDLDEIDDEYVLDEEEPQYFHGKAMRFLEDLMEEAEDDDIDLQILSAYRSFDEQSSLKGQFTQIYGSGANTFSADQGYSEHQLGTTVDFVSEGLTSAEVAFAETEAYEWLLRHAHKYGFTLSYPEGNNFYIYEPWHWRFVGEDLARDLERKNDHFYDWDQREIDEYLIKIFD